MKKDIGTKKLRRYSMGNAMAKENKKTNRGRTEQDWTEMVVCCGETLGYLKALTENKKFKG